MRKIGFSGWLVWGVLAVCCMASWRPAAAHADTATVNGVTWTYAVSNGAATVTQGPITGSAVIPSKLGGYPVRRLGRGAFRQKWLTSVTIPDSVTDIESEVFSGCNSLASLTIGTGVKYIGENAFSGCNNLAEVQIHDLTAWCGITVADAYATPLYHAQHFYLEGKEVAGDLAIPNGVTKIGARAFYNRTTLTTVTIPDSVKSIGNHAFHGCEGLATATLGNSVTNLGSSAFGQCTGLAHVTIGNNMANIEELAFTRCRNLQEVAIPDSVTNIGVRAFEDCSSLASATIGKGVRNIGSSAFSGCTNLETLNISESNASYKGVDGVLFSKDGSCLIWSCPGVSGHYTIPDGVTCIGNEAFCSTNLTAVTVPASVTNLEKYALGGIYGITSWVGPFTGCTGLKTIYAPEAWNGTTMLVDIGLPEGCEVVYGPAPSLVLGSSSRIFAAAAANSKELGVTATVPWTAKSSASWLTVKTASGSGNGKIVYNVAANAGTASRTGQITVTGSGLTQTFTVVQEGADGGESGGGGGGNTAAALTLGTTSRTFTSAAAGGKELGVTANVAWTAKSSASWLTVKTASGSGNGTIVYNVAANTGTASRTGKITVTGGGLTQTFTVVQSGSSGGSTSGGSTGGGSGGGGNGNTTATLTLWAASRTFTAAAAGGKELGVTANVAWTAKSSVSWLTLKTAKGNGNGKLTYSVAANTGTGSRTGKITVSGGGLTRTFTVTQSGTSGGGSGGSSSGGSSTGGSNTGGSSSGGNGGGSGGGATTVVLTLGTSEREFGCVAASGKELGVTANVSWSAKSSVSWVTLNKRSGTGNGKIVFNVAENTGLSERTGKITVSGGGKTATCTIRQKAKKAVLEVPAEGRTFGSGGQSNKECKVTANVEWEATPSESWIKLAKASGKGNGTIVYNVAKNPGAKRTAVITVKGGGKTVKYRIVQDAIQRANKKFALCVGIDDAKIKPCCANDAKYFAENLAARGGNWSSIKKFSENGATQKAIRSYITNTIAAQTIPGDTFVYFHSSHGGRSSNGQCFLSTADYSYMDTEFAEDLGKFPAGVKIVVILNACHSGGMIRKSKVESGFPFAERVSDIMDGERIQSAARGRRGFVNKISSSEIGWVTSSAANQQSYCPGYYDTGDWIFGGNTGSVKGSIFTTAFTWGWWYGEADAQGDGDLQFDAYEGYCFAKQYCESNSPSFSPQCFHEEVLRRVELGSCGRANLKFCQPKGWPAAVFVTTDATSTNRYSTFTASKRPVPCIRYAWSNDCKHKVTETGTAARPYTVCFQVSGPNTSYTRTVRSWGTEPVSVLASKSDPTNSLMPGKNATMLYYFGPTQDHITATSAPSVAGNYTVTITLDSENQVTESNESDNTTNVTFRVVSGRGTKKSGPEARAKESKGTSAHQETAGQETGTEGWSGLEDPGEWVTVTTSDGEDGGTLLDGDEATAWGPKGDDGGWVVLSYSEAITVKEVVVKGENLPEGSVRVLLSEDADEWREEREGRAQYVWVVVPEGATGAKITEIEVVEK